MVEKMNIEEIEFGEGNTLSEQCGVSEERFEEIYFDIKELDMEYTSDMIKYVIDEYSGSEVVMGIYIIGTLVGEELVIEDFFNGAVVVGI